MNDATSVRVPAGYQFRVSAQASLEGAPNAILDPPRDARLTGSGPAAFAGPVRGVRGRLPVTATLTDATSGPTPWGSYLAGEEGFHRWFDVRDLDWRPTETELRYGLGPRLPGGARSGAQPRLDLGADPSEADRYGWVVELDINPDGTPCAPVKRTALGRFNPVGATAVECEGRVVVYSGDHENGGYLYKFVGADTWRRERARGRSPLDNGVLHVAQFAADGSGHWLPLVHGHGLLTVENGWRDQADVLLRTRLAADALGATPLGRPQQVAVDPRGESAYCAIAGGTRTTRCQPTSEAGQAGPDRELDAPPWGHVLRWRENAGDATATAFRWDVTAWLGDSAGAAAMGAGDVGFFGRPRGLSVDPDGRLWIRTALVGTEHDLPEPVYRAFGNDAVLAADPMTGEVRRFLTVPRGREITAVVLAPDRRSLYVSVRWSATDSRRHAARPDPVTYAVRRRGGGVIGS
ncbi:alkaline phosphatase PhoX [Micromonospora sp. NPDC048999]|uniref:PhoX family protein n=1 Tax=Micromonospora sp. NPDC048999 TaxID=3155391 RepID=UPI0033F4682C